MSLTRKMLAAMEIDPEKIEQIIAGHSESVTGLQGEIDSLKTERDQYKADLTAKTSKLEETQKELANLKKTVAEDEKAREGKDYDKLLEEFNEFKEQEKKREVNAKKETVYKGLMKDAGIPEKHWAKILKYTNLDEVELDDKGNAKNGKELLKALGEEWGDHKEVSTTQGAVVTTPPENKGDGMTREQILAIKDTSARQAAISQHHNLFGY